MEKRKVRVIIAMVVIVLLCVVLFLIFRNKDEDIRKGLTMEFISETKELEYGSTIEAKELVKSSTGEIKEYPTVDAFKIGEQEIIFILEKEGVTKEIPYTITIKDTQAPVIITKGDSQTIALNEAFNVQNIITSVQDPVDGDIPFTDGEIKENSYIINGSVDVSKEGTYSLNIKAMDKNGNTKEETVEVIVSTKDAQTSNTDIEPTYIKGILLVNKQYGLPRDFGELDSTAYAALNELQAAAAIEGHSMQMISGYRSYDYQVDLYNSYVARDGQEAADRYSARPGYSEHQSGLCFDVGAIDNDYGTTPAGKWLAAHAHEYGFIIRFPEGKENITGYMYEPWHIRYVGSTAAKEIYQRGITLEEYLGVA